MEILNLKWCDFKSFYGEHEIDFQQFGPGLYFMKGENQYDPELGANGSGKSTVWDVLHWCLFGSSIRGTKTPQLVPWQDSGMPWAEVTYRDKGKTITVSREYKPSKLIVTMRNRDHPYKQEQLDDLVGFSPETFESSIVIGQFSRMFFDLKPREKLSVFTDLLNLDYWLERSAKASSTLKVLKEDQRGLEQELALLEGERKTLRFDLNSIKREQQAQSERGKSIESLKEGLEDYQQQHSEATEKLAQLREEMETNIEREKALSQRIQKLSTSIKNLNAKIRDLNEIKSDAKHEGKLLAELMDSASAVCPTCGQSITETHRRKEAGKIRQRLKKLKSELVDYDANLERLDELRDKLETLKERRNKGGTKKTQADINSTLKEIDAYQSVIDSNRQQITFIESSDTLYKKKTNRYVSRLRTNRNKQSDVKKQLRDIEVTASQVGYWVKGFKDIRLFEVEEARASLQVEVNSYLADLGMPDWNVTMEVERETRSGKLTKEFRVMVDPGIGSNSAPKPWEVWSGGEGQRLRLAGTLALSNLILRQFDRDCNIQVWDEKLYWLSGTGEDDMLDLLRETAKQSGKQIWLIDQHNLNYPFDGVVRIVRDDGGSHVVI